MIELTKEESKTAWFALTAYRDKLIKDLETQYGGHPRWGLEDVEFLESEIQNAKRAILALEAQGITF